MAGRREGLWCLGVCVWSGGEFRSCQPPPFPELILMGSS